MLPLEDTWLLRVVRFWNSLASHPAGHLFARVAKGDYSLGVTTWSPTWAGSLMQRSALSIHSHRKCLLEAHQLGIGSQQPLVLLPPPSQVVSTCAPCYITCYKRRNFHGTRSPAKVTKKLLETHRASEGSQKIICTNACIG